ncbi:hypothetical protein THIOKS1670020 [Thiocapsa sp. KS1]|nr:hypothetical protein THIOKS1670020 [Thiocapsa sp. KS1]
MALDAGQAGCPVSDRARHAAEPRCGPRPSPNGHGHPRGAASPPPLALSRFQDGGERKDRPDSKIAEPTPGPKARRVGSGGGTFSSMLQECCGIAVCLGQVRPELQGSPAVRLIDSTPTAGVNLCC